MASIQEIIGVGTPPILARMLGQNRLRTILAEGSSQADANPLTVNFGTIGTSAPGQGVRLGYARAAALTALFNLGPDSVLVYPAEGDTLNDLGADLAITVPAGNLLIAVPSMDHWLALSSPGDLGSFADAPADGGIYAREDGAWVPAVGEAPEDGQPYVRAEGDWVVMPVPPPSGTDAPLDGLAYGRAMGDWAPVAPEAPADGALYARQNGTWAPALGEAPVDGEPYVRANAAWAVMPPPPPGTVTSVDAAGGATGMTFSGGPIVSSGTLTLGGTLGAANGGTGAGAIGGEFTVAGGALALAALNPNVGTFQGLTLNAKGQVTGASNQGYWVQNANWSFGAGNVLTGSNNAAAVPVFPFGAGVQIVGADAGIASYFIDSFAASATIAGRRADGTNAAKAALAAGATVLTLVARGYDGAAYSTNAASIAGVTINPWSATDHSTSWQVRTIAGGAISSSICATFAGGLSVGTPTDNGAGTVTASSAFLIGSRNIQTGKATLQTTQASPAGTASATQVMMGFAAAITPAFNGAILVTIAGAGQQSVAAAGGTVRIAYGTGTAPANGAALAGTLVGSAQSWYNAVAGVNGNIPFSVTAVITGLVAGTTYWLDLAGAAIGGGTASLKQATLSAHEI